MQITHPGHAYFVSDRDIPDNGFPLFLDYAVHVYERFKHYAEEQHSGTLSDRSLYSIIDQMKRLNDSDEPMTVFPIREDLKNSLLDFEMVCDSMSRCFTSPLIVSSFYMRLGERMKEQVATFAGVEI